MIFCIATRLTLAPGGDSGGCFSAFKLFHPCSSSQFRLVFLPISFFFSSCKQDHVFWSPQHLHVRSRCAAHVKKKRGENEDTLHRHRVRGHARKHTSFLRCVSTSGICSAARRFNSLSPFSVDVCGFRSPLRSVVKAK